MDTLASGPPGKASLPLRLWRATPDWVFRALGASFFLIYAAVRMRDYFTDFPNVGPYWAPIVEVDALGAVHYGPRRYLPLAKVLIDATYLLIALSFIFRTTPRRRAASRREILLPLVAGFWPFLPFFLQGLLQWTGSPLAARLDAMLGYGRISYAEFYFGVMLLCVGNGLDVWGYGTLFRSLSIVAEARQLRTGGPYRYVRHPIYLGQFIAQAGVWLVLVRLQLIWVVFYLVFVAMQLRRARVEEAVLAAAFGEPYLAWKRRTFWFI
jgi:protein-S-isoprenylcysteine O-methyltransferase Ste14